MDSMIMAAARALAAGDPLSALNRVALREDAAALALRGVAMAQIGDQRRAKALLRRAVRAFGAKDAVARARCELALAEIALATRDLDGLANMLSNAREALDANKDQLNAAYARYLELRRLLLIGRVDDAERSLMTLDARQVPSAARVVHELIVFGVAVRRRHVRAARMALARAARAARLSGVPALIAEVRDASEILIRPAARLIAHGNERMLRLDEVEKLMRADAFIVDACSFSLCEGGSCVSLKTRPVLFTLMRGLAEAWPDDVSRDALVALVFRGKGADESYRARLRVEIGRLRTAIRPLAAVIATKGGFALMPRSARDVIVLRPPFDDKHAPVLALLFDGESWSSSALALALGRSQRTVQRDLETLAAAGRVQGYGQGRARRWATPPMPGFTTALVLPVSLIRG